MGECKLPAISYAINLYSMGECKLPALSNAIKLYNMGDCKLTARSITSRSQESEDTGLHSNELCMIKTKL